MKPREIFLASLVGLLLIVAAAVWFSARSRDATGVGSARNLQQWGIALNLYLIDNENQLPEVGASPVEPGQAKAWYNALPPYLSQTPLADLPPDARPRPGTASLWIDPSGKAPRVWDPSVFFFNYGMNRFLQPSPEVRSFRINELGYPGNVVFLAEVNGYDPDATPETVVFNHGARAGSPQAVAQILFCDGHVAPVTKAVLADDPASRSAAQAETGVSWFEQ